MKGIHLILAIVLGATVVSAQEELYRENDGRIYFISEAPLEIIEAASDNLKGAVNTQSRTFAFSVDIITFEGFNSPLQRTHFNENYMESDRFPNANFSGKIIEDIDFTVEGEYEVRAKGDLTIHGVTVERIISGLMTVGSEGIRIDAKFTVPLADHSIKIPTIVNQRIAEIINVEVRAILEQVE